MSAPPDPSAAVRAAQFRQLTEALADLEANALPADRALDRFFRSRRFLGGRDRRFIAEAVFGVLRRRRLYAHCLRLDAGASIEATDLAGLYLLSNGWSQRALARFLPADQVGRLADALRAVDPATLPFAIRHSLPEALADALVRDWGEEAESLAQALATEAPLDLRVNTLRTDRETLRARLAGAGIALDPTPFSPYGLRRQDRAALFTAPGFKEGAFEVQDEGSQLLACLVDVPPRGRVVDFCAGAGGKTLALAMELENKGEILACDVVNRKLEELMRRARRAGVHNVRTHCLPSDPDAFVRAQAGRHARVLVDAPCSGSGTLRRNPDLRNRPLDLTALTALQRQILETASALVAPGGRLIYATCSVMDVENRAVVTDFLQAHPEFVRLPARALMTQRNLTLPASMFRDDDLQPAPHRHGTDGFYAAVLERVRAT